MPDTCKHCDGHGCSQCCNSGINPSYVAPSQRKSSNPSTIKLPSPRNQLVLIKFAYEGVKYQTQQVITLNENNELSVTSMVRLREAMRARLHHLGYMNNLDMPPVCTRPLNQIIEKLKIVVII